MTLYRAVAFPTYKLDAGLAQREPMSFLILAGSSTEATRKLIAYYRHDEPDLVTGVEVLTFEAIAQDSTETAILT